MNNLMICKTIKYAMKIALNSDHRCKIGCVVTNKR